MTAVPQLDVPDIFVEDDDASHKSPQRPTMPGTPRARATTASSTFLTAADAVRPHHMSWASSEDISTYDSSYAHPLSFPRASPSMPGHNSEGSAFSFEIQEPGSTSGDNSRRGSSVNPTQVRELLDDSVWVESIRRSATIHKSVRRSDWSQY
jgi:hypothetical protein